jgi:hypothetical protein
MSEQDFISKIHEEYGYQKSLQEILEELSIYCSVNFVYHEDNKIKLILPDKIMKQYSKIAFAKERIILNGNIVHEPKPIMKPVLYTAGGTIALFTDEDYTVTKKRRKKNG